MGIQVIHFPANIWFIFTVSNRSKYSRFHFRSPFFVCVFFYRFVCQIFIHPFYLNELKNGLLFFDRLHFFHPASHSPFCNFPSHLFNYDCKIVILFMFQMQTTGRNNITNKVINIHWLDFRLHLSLSHFFSGFLFFFLVRSVEYRKKPAAYTQLLSSHPFVCNK